MNTINAITMYLIFTSIVFSQTELDYFLSTDFSLNDCKTKFAGRIQDEVSYLSESTLTISPIDFFGDAMIDVQFIDGEMSYFATAKENESVEAKNKFLDYFVDHFGEYDNYIEADTPAGNKYSSYETYSWDINEKYDFGMTISYYADSDNMYILCALTKK